MTRAELKAADARYMDFLIKQARARFAALPASVKAGMVRALEDGAAQAAREGQK